MNSTEIKYRLALKGKTLTSVARKHKPANPASLRAMLSMVINRTWHDEKLQRLIAREIGEKVEMVFPEAVLPKTSAA